MGEAVVVAEEDRTMVDGNSWLWDLVLGRRRPASSEMPEHRFRRR